jgi:PAS domain S-box-containing protein
MDKPTAHTPKSHTHKLDENPVEREKSVYRTLIQTSLDGFWINDFSGRILDVNEALCRMLGYTREELLRMSIPDIEVAESPEETAAHIQKIIRTGSDRFQTRHRRKDGAVIDVEASAQYSAELGERFFAFLRDISERKRLEQTQARLVAILEATPDFVGFADAKDTHILFINKAGRKMTGLSEDEDVTQLKIADVHPEWTNKMFNDEIIPAAIRDGTWVGECAFLNRNNGRETPVMMALLSHKAPGGEIEFFSTISRDITERKQAEAKILATQAELQKLLDAANQSRRAMLSVIEDQKQTEVEKEHANRALATLGAVNRTLVRAASEGELLQSICQAIVQQRGYRLAWVGYVQHDENKSIKIMARAGHDEGYLDTMQLTWAETGHGMGPSGRAIRSGATQINQDIANDPLCLRERNEVCHCGYAASIALPLLNGDNAVFGILTVYSDEVNAFTADEIALLEEMAGDMAFGVRTLHIRRDRDIALTKNQEQLVQLQDSLEDTVRAIATIVEMRDPYTAGHQVRVADLAAAIAKQMALPEEQIHAIHLAGTVHDLGKINIPAEILSKPGKITDIEFSLIKIHPQAGYDILKGIDFPWPIAQMVLQHHERLDGSGYPQGLKGEAILLEARILSVADVVEAMSSHRPYRAGLGIEVALEEITKQRGIHFDTNVVDACLALFREQGYSFA